MAYLIDGRELSAAWLDAIRLLVKAPKGKLAHLNVAFPASATDDEPHPVRDVLDAFLSERDLRNEDKDIWQVGTVANTIFPEALYHPHLGAQAARCCMRTMRSACVCTADALATRTRTSTDWWHIR